MSNTLQRRQFSLLAFVFQSIFVVLLAIFGRYDANALPSGSSNPIYINTDYPLFQDIHVMVIVGFGFLMSFLKRYGFSAISVNLLLSAFVIQLTIADLSCVCAHHNGCSPRQTHACSIPNTRLYGNIFCCCSEHILFTVLHINDGGRSLVVHCFGAYFGLAAAKVVHRKNVMADEENFNHSELFSMIGTLFLWIFFSILQCCHPTA
uniref:Ammonium transporter AmtB-like domain-containing protein n=1 Tax=Ditylenchus dipsaci TaxID=166011 RepID=A0A915DJ89_9BILA